MTPDRFLDVVNSVEASHPVATWRAAGISAWPIIRTRAMRWTEVARAAASRGAAGSATASPGGGLRRVARGAVDASLTDLLDRSHRVGRRPPRADVLMLGDAVSRIPLDGVWYDRFLDPLVESLAELGSTAVQLQPHHVYRRPRASPSMLVQPSLDRVDAWNRVAPLPGPLEGDGWPEAAATLRAAGVPQPALVTDEVVRECSLVVREAARLGRVFARVRPRLAVHVDYTVPAMAFTLAARRAGLPSVELQHAIPPVTHPMYARWTGTPPGGYEVLPSHYWTWEDEPATVLREWTDAVVDGPQVLVGGNPWLERWLDGGGAQVARHDARLQHERALHPGARHVLLTFETSFTGPAVLEPLLRAAASTRGRARWWYRLHPTMRHEEAERVRAELAAHGGDAVFADMTGEPLYALLRHVDAHVTHASSTTQEAALFGVRTVLTAPHGADVYASLVRDGWARVATDAEALAATALALTRSGPPHRGDRDGRAREQLRALLAGPESAG